MRKSTIGTLLLLMTATGSLLAQTGAGNVSISLKIYLYTGIPLFSTPLPNMREPSKTGFTLLEISMAIEPISAGVY